MDDGDAGHDDGTGDRDGFDTPALRPQECAAPSRARSGRPAAVPRGVRGRPAHRHRRGRRTRRPARIQGRAAGPLRGVGRHLRRGGPHRRSRRIISVRPGPGGGRSPPPSRPWSAWATPSSPSTPSGTPVAKAVADRDALDPLLMESALWHASPTDIAELREILPDMASASAAARSRAFVHFRLVAARPRRHRQPARRAALAVRQPEPDRYARPRRAARQRAAAAGYIRSRHVLHMAVVDALEQHDHDKALSLIAQHDASSRRRSARPAGRPAPDGARSRTAAEAITLTSSRTTGR